MAVTMKVYGQAVAKAFNKEIDWNSDSIKAMLCTSAYTPNQDTHAYKSDVTNEVVGTGYVAGGAVLTTCTVSYDAASNTVTLDADDVSWAGSTITARYVVLYDATPGSDATRPLIAFGDFGADQSSGGGAFLITWSASGIVGLVAA